MRAVPAIERFYGRIERLPWSGCWIWTKGVNNTGYGSIGVGGKWQMAHRFSWESHRGNIPPGKFVLHSCDVRCCVNPEHLFIGDQRENQRDAQNKGRRYKQLSSQCKNGHDAKTENVYFNNGHRYCLLCKRASRKRLKDKNK